MILKILSVFCLLLFLGIDCQNVQPFYNKIYKPVHSVFPCILRLNGTHSFGCTSSFGGNLGIIYKAEKPDDIKWLEENKGSFIIMMNLNLFTLENLDILNQLNSVNGIILLLDETYNTTRSFSNEDTCPNRYSGLGKLQSTCSSTQPWNPWGSKIMLRKWKFPIFVIEDNNAKVAITECYRKFNLDLIKPWSSQQCSLQMFSHMSAGVNSKTCMRRNSIGVNLNPLRYCDPMANKNIYVPLYPLHLYKKTKDRSIIIVAAQLDSTSMFSSKEPGALSVATSVVTLMTTAAFLFGMLPYNENHEYEENVLFMLFNGESYDYIGSGRTIYDMEHGKFPYSENSINKNDIRMFVEISQISKNETIVTHYLRQKQTAGSIEKFTSKFKSFAASYGLNMDEFSSETLISPASLQNFILADDQLPGVILASYKEEFTNEFYHSIYDDSSNANYVYFNDTPISNDSLQASVYNISAALASTLYWMISNDSKPIKTNKINYHTVDELLYCYLGSVTCSTFRRVNENIGILLNGGLSYYVGVRGSSETTILTEYTLASLISPSEPTLNSSQSCVDKNQESTRYRYIWILDEITGSGHCIRSSVNRTDAVSPAFIIEDYDLSLNNYSTWTESQWRSTEMRIFVSASKRYELITFTTGLLIFIISYVSVYRFKVNAEYLGIQG